MEVVLHSLQSIMSIVLLVILGAVLAKHGWFDEKDSKLIATLVTKISLPCVVLLNITNNFDRSNFLTLLQDLALPALSIIISYFIGSFFCHILKVPQGRQAIFKAMFYVANCLFIGLPINIALFGEKSIIYVFEYYVPNTIALWSVVVYQFAAEGSNNTVKIDFLDTLKKVIFSPLIGLIIAIILILLNIKIPIVLQESLKYIGNLTTPLSMLFLGIALSKTKLAEMKLTLEMNIALLGRFVLSPATLFLLHFLIPINDLQLQVLIIQAAMPVAAVLPVLASTYGLDVKYASILTSVSTILFMLIVPLYMWLLHLYITI